MEEAEVLQILTQVNVVRRECEIVSVGEGAGVRRELDLRAQGVSFRMVTPHDGLSLPPRNWRRPTLMRRRRLTSGSR